MTERYAATHGIPDESKIPHPTTWLNQCRWETVDATDKPAAPRTPMDNNTIEAWLGEPLNEPDFVDAEFWEHTSIEEAGQ